MWYSTFTQIYTHWPDRNAVLASRQCLLHIKNNVSILTDFTYLVPPSCLFWYSRFEVTWLLRDDSNSKTRVRFVYVLPHILNGDFVNEIKYFTYNNQKCYFLLWLFQLRWTLIHHIQVFHVNKTNTYFAVKSHLSKVMWRQSENTTKTRWRD